MTACGERWFVRQTMRSLEHALPSDLFLRVHRTAIVNLHRVERVDRNGEENTSLRLYSVRRSVPVGRRVWQKLKAPTGEATSVVSHRSEERRVGKECRSRWS